MFTTPRGLRLHIGFFGRRNVGKSSVLNALLNQTVSIVSDVAGTTTDPVEKVMEFKPIGPVVFIDTAGIDDVGALGQARVQQTMKVIDRTELALLVTDAWLDYERQLLTLLRARNIPVVIAANKADVRSGTELEDAARGDCEHVVTTDALSRKGLDDLRRAIIGAAPPEFLAKQTIVGGLVKPGDLVVLVTPIDLEAPKGRLILPQVQVLRDVLDHHGYALVVKESELAEALARLKEPPVLVVTDSQAFEQVSRIVPPEIPLTSFSILFARFKGDLTRLADGAAAIENLRSGDKVLIAEACTHHPVKDDIGREKIPRWLQKYTGCNLDFTIVAGRDWPEDLSGYKLIVHCAACVFNRQEMITRIEKARAAGIPVTNYGMAISYMHGIFERAMQPFTELRPTGEQGRTCRIA